MYFAYILQSVKDNSFYIGSTSNLENRIVKHNRGYSRYTKSKRPWKIAHKEQFETLSEARARESYLKSLKSSIAIKKLITAPSSSG